MPIKSKGVWILFGVAAGLALAYAATSLSGESAARPMPTTAVVSGQTWCGAVFRMRGAPVSVAYENLARYIDGGATVVGFTSHESTGETYILCGPVAKADGG